MAKITWSTTENRWICKIQVDGERKKFTSSKPGQAGKREVSRKVSAFLAGELDFSRAKVSEVWNEFLNETIDRLGKGEMYKQLEMYGRLYLLPLLGSKRIAKVRLADYQAVISTAKPIKDPNGELSKKSLSTLRNCVAMFVKFAVAHQYIEPLRGELYIPKGHHTKGQTILQPNQIGLLFEPSNEHYIEALRFMLVTGLRPGECLGLKWTDIDNNVLTVARSINARGIVTNGKNENAHRSFILPGIACEILKRQKAKTSALCSEWIFCNTIGNKPAQTNVYDCYKRLAELHGFGGSPYSLRHTFVSMVKNDVPLEMLKAVVGHSDAMDTLGVYGHRVNGEMEQTARVIDLALASRLKQEKASK